jgi:hypothetical protein
MKGSPHLGKRSCIAILGHGDGEQPANISSAHLSHASAQEGIESSRKEVQKITSWIKTRAHRTKRTISLKPSKYFQKMQLPPGKRLAHKELRDLITC